MHVQQTYVSVTSRHGLGRKPRQACRMKSGMENCCDLPSLHINTEIYNFIVFVSYFSILFSVHNAFETFESIGKEG